VRRIDAIFDIERAISGLTAAERLAHRQRDAQPLVDDLEAWMRRERARLSWRATITVAGQRQLG
jgi:transposase